MFSGPRISLVTPTFNQASTLRETIESVLGQDYGNLEYWIFDGGSRDGTVDIMRDYENDVRFHWASEKDKGQSNAINKGLARCTGEIFNWINSDDYLEAGALTIVAQTFQKNRNLDVVSGKTVEFRGDPPQAFNTIHLPLRSSAEATITVGTFCQPSTFWRIERIRELGGIDESLHYVMDWDLWVRYLARYGQQRVRQIDHLLAHYRHHAQAKTSAGSDKFYEEAKSIFQELLLAQNAPSDFLRLENLEPSTAPVGMYTFGPEFDRDKYLGAYAERMVRIHRRKSPALAKKWLAAAFGCKPWITLWRIKMMLRLLFR